MNTSTIAIILGTAITSAGITYVITSENSKPLPAALQETEATPKSTTSPTVNTPANPRPKTSTPKTSTPKQSSQKETSFTKPEGISDKIWKEAQDRAKMYSGWANRARESGWLDRRRKERVERDLKSITEKLGLEGTESEAVETLLSSRMEASTERTNKVYDAMLSNEEGLTTLLALREMSEEGETISPDLIATKEAYKKDMFGEFFENKDSLSDEDVIGLLRPTRPERWYKDDEFLITASSELGENQASSLVEYAGKMDYLDRKEDASEKINRIERSVDLQPQQASALEKLYIDTPSPTDEQLSIIVGADKVEALKSSTSRRGRDRGRGGRR